MNDSAANSDSSRPDRWTALGRGVLLRCPHCGEGKLFRAYLKPVNHCATCGEDFADVRADDMTSWATILMAGIVLAPLIAAVELNTNWPTGISVAVWCGIAIALMLLILPRAKGFLMAVIWLMRRPASND